MPRDGRRNPKDGLRTQGNHKDAKEAKGRPRDSKGIGGLEVVTRGCRRRPKNSERKYRKSYISIDIYIYIYIWIHACKSLHQMKTNSQSTTPRETIFIPFHLRPCRRCEASSKEDDAVTAAAQPESPTDEEMLAAVLSWERARGIPSPTLPAPQSEQAGAEQEQAKPADSIATGAVAATATGDDAWSLLPAHCRGVAYKGVCSICGNPLRGFGAGYCPNGVCKGRPRS